MQPYDLNVIPFSLAGSFLTLSSRSTINGARLAYRTCSGKAVSRQGISYPANDFFEIALTRSGEEVPYQWNARPDRLELITAGDGSAVFVFSDPDTILFKTRGVNLRLLPAKLFAAAWKPEEHQLQLVDHPARGIHQLRSASGTQLTFSVSPTLTGLEPQQHEQAYQVDFNGFEGAEGALRFVRYETSWKEPLADIDDCLVDREREYQDWATRIPQVPVGYRKAAEQAWFLLWNCQVPAQGALTRPAIYMSKFWMNNIWAWDNCFNALAIARADPDLAWQQILLFFDHQNPQGMVPDMINDLEAVYAFTKPPIQGWAIRKLVESLGPKRCLPYLESLYRPLGQLVDWWYTLRDFDGDGMPQYHHGNDSGWDNATIFDQGYPTEGADLAAYLVLQCETLAFIAQTLGKTKAADRWQDRANQQIQTLLKKGVDKKNHFFSPLDGFSDAAESLSLLNYIPIVLGKRLPGSLLDALVHDLAPDGPFLTEWGYASESPRSQKYEPDGYWRGPIWAPSTYLIVDGLIDAGRLDIARTAAERFCDLCVENPGFWENFDALTGKGLRCPGYSWTASVFLLLAEWLGTLEIN